MDITQVKYLFEKEFEALRNKFRIIDLSLVEAEISQELHLCMPGVYVFWHPVRGVIKVGRHFTNTRKRAFEHLRDNTGGVMAALKSNEGTRLILFNVKELKDKHWITAVEVFFEEHLSPEIKSGRLG